jgi:multidrug efflux pump subunit AcrA (membrane-fusion protein)
MTAESNIIIRKTDRALLVPAQAVANGRVWKIENGKAVQIDVVIGARSNDWTEIRAGISADDIVLRDGNARPDKSPRIKLVQP